MKWISVKDKLPERASSMGNSGNVLVSNGFWYKIMQYNHYYQNWEDETDNVIMTKDIKWWCDIERPPA